MIVNKGAYFVYRYSPHWNFGDGSRHIAIEFKPADGSIKVSDGA